MAWKSWIDYALSFEGHYEVLDGDNNYNRAFVGDYAECEEFMHQLYIDYEEGRIG